MYLPSFRVIIATDRGIVDLKATTNDKERAVAMVRGKYPNSKILKVSNLK